MQNTHRAVVLLKKLQPTETTRDTAVSLVWKFLNRQQFVAHYGELKPFNFSLKKYQDVDYVLTFTAIYPEITQLFMENCKTMEGTAISINGDNIFEVEKAYPLADLQFFGTSVRLTTMTGISVQKKNRLFDRSSKNSTAEKRGQKIRLLLSNNKEKWLEQIKNSLLYRTKEFKGRSYTKTDITLHLFPHARYEVVPYKGGRIPVQLVQIKITAPKDILEVAVYCGLGGHNGSGFGMCVPC